MFYLNLDDEMIIRSYIASLEEMRTILFYKKKPGIKEIMSKVILESEGIVAIFGSYAKDKEKEDSDLDIWIAGRFKEAKIENIGKTYHIDINVKHYPHLPTRTDPLIEEIIKDHIIVKSTDSFVQRVLKWKRSNGALI